MKDTEELTIKMALDAWNGHIKRADTLFNLLTDDQLQQEVAPGRNRGVYLLGHLTAVHDRMFPLLGIRDPLYPSLSDAFITQPDKAVQDLPATTDLRSYWKQVNDTLSTHFNTMQPDEWFQKHTAVSEEDFEKEPHRNKLNILMSRTNHLAYHFGQVAFLKSK